MTTGTPAVMAWQGTAPGDPPAPSLVCGYCGQFLPHWCEGREAARAGAVPATGP